MTRRVGIVTSSRADFGLLRRLMLAVAADPAFDLIVYATGMHHSARHGTTIAEVRSSEIGRYVVDVESWIDGDDPANAASSMGRGLTGFAQAFAARRPDVLVVLGDRYDMVPAVLAALPFVIPVAHISGGELTAGAIDDNIRHAITKLSHLHFPSTEDFARRIRQMGEEAERIVVSGQPGLDEIADFQARPRAEVIAAYGLSAQRPLTLFTFHPETAHPTTGKSTIAAILAAAEMMETQILFTAPNSDPGSEEIRSAIESFVRDHSASAFRESLGRKGYMEILNHADCMVGNSSSGLIEAASFRIPVVNIGDRQTGRPASANVISCAASTEAVADAWRHALDPSFRAGLAGLVNPYGDGHAVERIVAALKTVPLDHRFAVKRFGDWSGAGLSAS